jgi:hypothetical protein
VASVIDPRLPLRTALLLKTMHVLLVKTPLPEPVSVPRPMKVPRPVMLPLPEACVPLAAPDPCPL